MNEYGWTYEECRSKVHDDKRLHFDTKAAAATLRKCLWKLLRIPIGVAMRMMMMRRRMVHQMVEKCVYINLKYTHMFNFFNCSLNQNCNVQKIFMSM